MENHNIKKSHAPSDKAKLDLSSKTNHAVTVIITLLREEGADIPPVVRPGALSLCQLVSSWDTKVFSLSRY